jgi:8-oxo-dGTP pyrophosphatase MutT (NUDIX family)/phosphohistidine phosphatase SixA
VTELIRAAGAVLWRRANPGIQVCLVHRPKYDDWSLPKGKVDDSEHIVTTAVREVYEETGHRVMLGRPLPTQHYEVDGRPKEVRYWAAEADPRITTWHGTREIDQVIFLPIDEAMRRLDRPADRDIVSAFAEDPAPTTPLIILRHSKALPRSTWLGDDGERPLAEEGLDQSRRLVPVLAAYGINRVVTSAGRRCVESVEPYATMSGLEIEHDARLAEDADGQVAGIVDEALESDAPTVLCTHRPLLPDLLKAAGIPPPDEPLQPSDLLVAHHRRAKILAIERHGV